MTLERRDGVLQGQMKKSLGGELYVGAVEEINNYIIWHILCTNSVVILCLNHSSHLYSLSLRKLDRISGFTFLSVAYS